MTYIFRSLESSFLSALKRGRSVLLLGPRQTGKTTLLKRLSADLFLSMAPAKTRLQYEKDPSLLAKQIKGLERSRDKPLPLVILDEVQKVPALLDEVQELIDNNLAQFVLSGSSARKLRTAKANWLPGRVLIFHMDPLSLAELDPDKTELQNLLIYGSLPHIITTESNTDRQRELKSYVGTYLEEEIRAEAAVRQVGLFARFLELAASESGNIVNFSKLSQEIGVAQSTIASYYQIIEDCLIAERIEPLTRSKTRRKLTRAAKYVFFDLGVRRLAADEGTHLPTQFLGALFEQFVGLELIRLARLLDDPAKVLFWRDPGGPEVDWLLEVVGKLFPVEAKLTATPSEDDIRHLKKFLDEYPEAKAAYVVCQTEHRLQLADRIWGISWRDIRPELFA